MVTGLGSLLLTGALAVCAIGWLSKHRHPLAHVMGIVLASVACMFCTFVAFALIPDNIGSRLRLGGVLSTLAFAAIGGAAAIEAWRGSKTRAATLTS